MVRHGKREGPDGKTDPALKILIVDDKRENRYLLESMLGAQGFGTESASNGIEALEHLKKQHFDAIISDLLMPKMDGFQLIRTCKKDPALNKIPFIIYTATYTDKKDVEFGLSLGAARYLIKPTEPDDLLRELNETLGRVTEGILEEAGPAVENNGKTDREYIRRLVAKLDKKILDLEKSEEKYRLLAETSPEMIYLIDNDGYVQYVNQTAARQFHTEPDRLAGKHLSEIFPPQTARNHLDAIKKVVADRQVLRREIIEEFPDRTVYIEVCLTPVINSHEQVTGVLGLSNDITQRKKAEEQREILIRELAQKNAELDRFTYTVSHDLKSPLVAIRAYLSFLVDDLTSGNAGQVQTDITYISESAEKLELLITTLLVLSRSGKSVDTPVRIPFMDLVREASGLLEASLQGRGVTLVIPDNLPVVNGDHQRLLQVMTNLLDNAVKFMGDQKEPRIEIGVRDDAGTPVFFVQDNGMGISKENLPKAFGLFERFNPDIPGSGIGLATVKRIIEAHGGKVWAESEGLGKGTTFRFTLPGAGDACTDNNNNG